MMERSSIILTRTSDLADRGAIAP